MRRVASGIMIITTAFVLASGTSAFGAEKKAKKATKAAEAPAEAAAPAPSPTPAVEPTPVPTPDTVMESVSDTAPSTGSRPLLGDFSIGPVIQLVNIPHPAMIGLETKFKDIAGASFNFQVAPQLSLGGVSVKMNSWDLRTRWFPFSRAMFIGAAFGKQNIDATTTYTDTTTGQSTTIDLEADTTFLTPHIGWRWGAYDGTGFWYGMELGWQIAMSNETIGPNFSNPTVAALPGAAEKIADIRKIGDDIGSASLPHFTLIQFGWLF